MRKPTIVLIPFLNALGTFIMIYVNYLSISLPLNNQTPQDISQRYQTIITPPSITFSIWSVIYLSLLCFIIYQITRLYKNELYLVEKTGIWYFTSTLLNVVWLFVWHYEKIILSTVVMVLLFLNLIMLYKRIGIGEISVPTLDKIFMFFPFSIYTGWISIATVLNISVLLVYLNWNAFGIPHDWWGFIVISFVTCIGLAVVITKNDIFFGLTYLWALGGIFFSKVDVTQLVGSIKHPLTFSATVVGVILIFLSILYKVVKREIYT